MLSAWSCTVPWKVKTECGSTTSAAGTDALRFSPKTATIKRSSTGKWYVAFVCEWVPTPLPVSPLEVGIDVGLTTFAHLSTDETIPAPKFFRTEEHDLARVQRKHAKAEKGTHLRRKRRKVVARVHERVKFRRQNFTHQESRKIVNRFGIIAVEDLQVNRMVHHHCLAKSIHDAAWAGFAAQLIIKAASRTEVYRSQSRLHQPGL